MPMTPVPPPAGRLLYAASESCADLAYCSAFLAPDPFLWYETPTERGIVVSVLELGRARKEAASGTRVRSTDEARRSWGLPETRRAPEDLIAGLARETGLRAWSIPESFPVGLARQLGRRRLRMQVQTPFCPARELKSPAEVDKIREGVRLAEAGLECALEILRAAGIGADGMLYWQDRVLTAEELRGEITAGIARHGGIAARTITAAGVHGADPHDMGSGPIPAHVPIVLDIFPRVDRTGYYGDLTRTVVKGQASDLVRRAFAAVRAAQDAGFAKIAAGVLGKDVQAAAEAVLAAAGFRTDDSADPPRGFFHGLGHGLGLEIHEGPGLNRRNNKPLQAGHVVTVEPGLYYPEWGGIRLEDVIVVTATGCANLTTAAKILEIP